MKHLKQFIDGQLKTSPVCAVYDSQLARVFPKSISVEERKKRIQKFAARRGLTVDIFEIGLCAVFEKPPRSKKELAELNRAGVKKKKRQDQVTTWAINNQLRDGC
jgi:hypothetical protein